jgi:hypothetical protein
MVKEVKAVVTATIEEIRKNVNNHVTKESVKPTVEGAKILEFREPCKKLGLLTRRGTNREKILLLGLKGAYGKNFNTDENEYGTKLQSTPFWLEDQYRTIGLGWVKEDHGIKGEFLYYLLPEGVTEIGVKIKPVVEPKVKTEPKVLKKAKK